MDKLLKPLSLLALTLALTITFTISVKIVSSSSSTSTITIIDSDKSKESRNRKTSDKRRKESEKLKAHGDIIIRKQNYVGGLWVSDNQGKRLLFEQEGDELRIFTDNPKKGNKQEKIGTGKVVTDEDSADSFTFVHLSLNPIWSGTNRKISIDFTLVDANTLEGIVNGVDTFETWRLVLRRQPPFPIEVEEIWEKD